MSQHKRGGRAVRTVNHRTAARVFSRVILRRKPRHRMPVVRSEAVTVYALMAPPQVAE